jgi:hypothetical protein
MHHVKDEFTKASPKRIQRTAHKTAISLGGSFMKTPSFLFGIAGNRRFSIFGILKELDKQLLTKSDSHPTMARCLMY